MTFKTPRTRIAIAGSSIAAVALLLSACGSGDSATSSAASSSAGSGDPVEISFVIPADPVGMKTTEMIVESFETANPDVKVNLTTQPAGADGDNLIKTKLATGEMEDVFIYNAGAMLQGINPDTNLADLSGEAFTEHFSEDFKEAASGQNGMYGVPAESSQAGGILYNRKVYEELGLEIPKTWDEFLANCEKIKEAKPDVAPVIQTYGDTHTSQLILLGDFANVSAQDPDWAEKYTTGEAKFVDDPALGGFQKLQDIHDRGLMNEDFASATIDRGAQMLAEGTGVHLPMLTGLMGTVRQNSPDYVDDVGFFPVPAYEEKYTTATVWLPNAYYIPKTTTDEKLAAAKRFVDFLANSSEACEFRKSQTEPTGPFVTDSCELGDDVSPAVKDLSGYMAAGQSSPALEYLSPIKGPNLEHLLIEVGSGIKTAPEAAAAYDQDVEKQAKQLGIEGW